MPTSNAEHAPKARKQPQTPTIPSKSDPLKGTLRGTPEKRPTRVTVSGALEGNPSQGTPKLLNFCVAWAATSVALSLA